MAEMISKPRQIYEMSLKRQYHDGADAYFEELAEKAGTDKAANKIHVKEYEAVKAELDKAKKKLGAVSGGGIALVIFALIFLLGGIGLIVAGALGYLSFGIGLGIPLAVVGVVLFVLRFTVIRNSKKKWQAEVDRLQKIHDEKLKICYEDMASLNAILDWNMPVRVMEKASPIIDLDDVFSPRRLEYLVNHFGMVEELGPDRSVLGVHSGAIQGNPFVLVKMRRHELRDKTYTGTLVIHWTERVSDGKGGYTTVTRSQTLTATIVRPAPFYDAETVLIYGNEAAPHLHFSRFPSGMSGKSDKDVAKFVKGRIKEYTKQEKKALTNESNFTVMANQDFEALFGARDRDHEVEFRLLFTPLAQQNEIDLIRNPEPFGDDFVMVKDGMVNSVASGHSQGFDYSANPAWFEGYDYEAMKEKFVKYCDDFIRGLFFDLAPLLSIPLYQMHKPFEYIYQDLYPTHVTSYEQETLANMMDPELFRPKDAAGGLPMILKAVQGSKNGPGDKVTIKAYAYQTIPQVEMVPVMGGDGHSHLVPVHWTEYIPVSGENTIATQETGSSRKTYADQLRGSLGDYLRSPGGSSFQKGLLGLFLGQKAGFGSSESERIASLFSKEKK